MCDFKLMADLALKIVWVNRIQDESLASWKIIPDHIVCQYGDLTFLTKCNYKTKLLNLETYLHSTKTSYTIDATSNTHPAAQI